MSDLRKTAEMALWALEDIFGKEKVDVGAINALRQALAQPEQKPVVCRHEWVRTKAMLPGDWFCIYCCEWEHNTEPPKREWVGLTDEEVEAWRGNYDFFDSALVREVEAKLKEKNT